MKNIFFYDENSLEFKEYRIKSIITALAVLVISITILVFTLIDLVLTDPKQPEVRYILTENVVKKPEYKKAIFELIDSYPFKFKGLIKAQAIEESGNFKSAVFKENNNCLGMRLPHQRLTLATGSNLNHATYKCLEDCIVDRLIYEAKYLNDLNKKEYLAYLDSVYAESGGYSERLLKIEKSL